MEARLRTAARACAIVLCIALVPSAAMGDGPFPRSEADAWQWPPDHPFARYRTLSAPDCVDASSIVAGRAEGPVGTTYLRVQHIGDPGTEELEDEIANGVTWDVSYYTGLAVPPSDQRGFLDRFGQSAFQLHCAEAGFYIDSATFTHAEELQGGGPNVSIGRDFEPGFEVFAHGGSVVVEADVRAPTVRGPPSPVVDGTAQIVVYLYYHDRTTRSAVAQLVDLLDNRSAGVAGCGVEWAGHDGLTPFLSSPLATTDAAGAPVRFLAPLFGSAQTQYGGGWSEKRHVAFLVSPAHFAAALDQLRAQGARISADPADYVVTAVGVLGEVFPGTGHENEVALGASVANLVLRMEPLGGAFRL